MMELRKVGKIKYMDNESVYGQLIVSLFKNYFKKLDHVFEYMTL